MSYDLLCSGRPATTSIVSKSPGGKWAYRIKVRRRVISRAKEMI